MLFIIDPIVSMHIDVLIFLYELRRITSALTNMKQTQSPELSLLRATTAYRDIKPRWLNPCHS
jgi:hypothetical protein